jgi:hypothetical protein
VDQLKPMILCYLETYLLLAMQFNFLRILALYLKRGGFNCSAGIEIRTCKLPRDSCNLFLFELQKVLAQFEARPTQQRGGIHHGIKMSISRTKVFCTSFNFKKERSVIKLCGGLRSVNPMWEPA